MRAAANSMYVRSGSSPDLELLWPYVKDARDIAEEVAVAEQQRAQMDTPEMQAKLKAVREKALTKIKEQRERTGWPPR